MIRSSSSSITNTNGIWKQVNSDIIGENIGDQFGSSIGISQDGLSFVIGAPKYDQSGVIVTNCGQARVYSIMNHTNTSTTTSIQQVGISLIGQNNNDLFGTSVAMNADGTRIVVGAPLYDITERNINAGRVSVYEYKFVDASNSNIKEWTQVGTDIYGTVGFNNSDLFGASVAMSANGYTVVIGAPNHTSINNIVYRNDYFGYVQVYSYYDSRWRQIGLDIIGNTTNSISYNNSKFGTSVDISADGTMIVVGTVHDSTIIGYVRVYWLNGTAPIDNRWVQVGSDIVTQTTDIASSVSVAISGDGTTIIIGTIGNENQRNEDAGYVRVYKMTTTIITSSTSWIQVGSDITGDAISIDDSFISVAISYDGTVIAIGAPLNRNTNTEDSFAGLVRAYALVMDSNNNEVWKQIGSDLNSITDDNSGSAIALSDDGTILAIGAPFNNNGYVRIYQYDTSGIVPTISPTKRSTPPSNKNCGLFGLNIFCFGSGECGIIKRLFKIDGC